MAKRLVKVWSDGSAWTKNRHGGYGVYYQYFEDGVLKHDDVFNQGFSNATIGRMELRGVIQSMRLVKDKSCDVEIYSDSQYVIKGANEWLEGWKKKYFIGVKNEDLWREFIEERDKFETGKVKFIWIKGHEGNEGNEIADGLAAFGQFNGQRIKDCV